MPVTSGCLFSSIADTNSFSSSTRGSVKTCAGTRVPSSSCICISWLMKFTVTTPLVKIAFSCLTRMGVTQLVVMNAVLSSPKPRSMVAKSSFFPITLPTRA